MAHDDYELLDTQAACRFIGGTKPIDRSTLWRGVKAGRYSKPIHIGPQSVRWWRNELAADLERMARAREGFATSGE